MLCLTFAVAVINIIWKFINFLYKYRTVYKITGLFATRKFRETENKHKYAVLVAARNEETVIGNLIDSIRRQDYPSELVDIFVAADNCTDKTAETARKNGAVCYERFDEKHCTKGYALHFLVECIRKEYGIENYEGYFIFDADNILKSDYITRMNEAFDEGEKIITSYRNTKNLCDNWIAASYAVHWLRTIRNEHRARSLFRLATRIQGTGFLFASEIIENGWNYTGLTEDRAFCADAVANGYGISYNNDAIFYDEQPVSFRIAMRQRIRWAKGHIQALAETGPSLLAHVFATRGVKCKYANENESLSKRFINNIRLRFMSFDMLTVVFPKALVSVIRKFLLLILRILLIITAGEVFTTAIAPNFLNKIFKLLDFKPYMESGFGAIFWISVFTLGWTVSTYLKGILTAVYIYIIERKRIVKLRWYKIIWYCITFPMFDLMGRISLVIALFTKVEWKPIPHNASISITEIDEKHKR